MIKFAVLQPQDAHRLEQAKRAEGVGVRGVLRRLEAHLHVALRREVIDFVRAGVLQQADEVGGVGHVAVVQKEARPALMRVDVDVVDAPGIEGRRAALDAVHDVALIEEEARKKRAILTGDAGDQRDFVASIEALRHELRGWRMISTSRSRHVIEKPAVGLGDPLFQFDLWPPAEAAQFADVEQLAWGAVWLRWVGGDARRESRHSAMREASSKMVCRSASDVDVLSGVVCHEVTGVGASSTCRNSRRVPPHITIFFFFF